MIKQLRKKFITIAMISVVLVMVALVGTMNIINYINMNQETEQILNVLVENEGKFPEMKNGGMTPLEKPQGDDNGGWPRTPWGELSPEAPFQSRYFSVVVNDQGNIEEVNTGRIAAIDSSEAEEMTLQLYSQGKEKGYVGDYCYTVKEEDAGKKMYIFLDVRTELNSFYSFLRNSIMVSLVGLLGVFLLILALSKKAMEPVEISYAKQKKFITNAGHELKTPLAVMRSCTDVLEMEQGENKWIEGIRTQVGRMSELTNDLVRLARMDEHTEELPKQSLSISTLVKEVWEPFEASAQAKNQTFTLNIQEDVLMKGNEEMMKELSSILADNAVKYCPEGGTIELSMNKNGSHYIIQSKNTATGFEKGNQDQIFDRFYRQDETRNSEEPGFGIGLSIAQAIVENHHGEIHGESDGDTLTITAKFKSLD